MRITAITKFKHGNLYAALKRLCWTQSELARKSGISPQAIGSIINLHTRPTEAQANAIQFALGEAGEFMDVLTEWPESFVRLQRGFKHEQTEEIPLERLIGNREQLQIEAPETVERLDTESAVREVIMKLPHRESIILMGIFFMGNTLDELGKMLRVDRERVRQIMNQSLRKLRQPDMITRLYGLLPSQQASDLHPRTSLNVLLSKPMPRLKRGRLTHEEYEEQKKQRNVRLKAVLKCL